jgi:hypothetical protein
MPARANRPSYRYSQQTSGTKYLSKREWLISENGLS